MLEKQLENDMNVKMKPPFIRHRRTLLCENNGVRLCECYRTKDAVFVLNAVQVHDDLVSLAKGIRTFQNQLPELAKRADDILDKIGEGL
jgi:hypothetical protein